MCKIFMGRRPFCPFCCFRPCRLCPHLVRPRLGRRRHRLGLSNTASRFQRCTLASSVMVVTGRGLRRCCCASSSPASAECNPQTQAVRDWVVLLREKGQWASVVCHQCGVQTVLRSKRVATRVWYWVEHPVLLSSGGEAGPRRAGRERSDFRAG